MQEFDAQKGLIIENSHEDARFTPEQIEKFPKFTVFRFGEDAAYHAGTFMNLAEAQAAFNSDAPIATATAMRVNDRVVYDGSRD